MEDTTDWDTSSSSSAKTMPDWVLGRFSPEEQQTLQPAIDTAVEVIKSFVLAGIDITMNQYNKLGKK